MEFLVLLGELTDQFVGLALVDDGFVLDLFGLIGVTEGGEGLLVVVGGGGDGADH